MARATLNFLIDVATFLVMLAMVASGLLIRFVLPPGSGERRTVWDYSRHDWGDLHFWLAVLLGGFVLVHVALHWGWVCSVVARWFRSAESASRPHSRFRRNLLGAAMFAAIVLLVGGFLWTAQLAVQERQDGGRQYRGGRDSAHEMQAAPSVSPITPTRGRVGGGQHRGNGAAGGR